MKEFLDRIKKMAGELNAAFPEVHTIELHVSNGDVVLKFHRFSDNSTATRVMGGLGCGTRDKQVFDPDSPWHVLRGKTKNGIRVIAFVSGLPKTCRLEKVTERIPKTSVVDTGEFIEVERTKIVCGKE